LTNHDFSELLRRHSRWLFIVGHPGHELRVHHMLERTRPTVAVLTDGSGSAGVSRLGETQALLDGVDGRPAPVFGAMSDRDAYAAILAGDPGPFQGIGQRLSNHIVSSGVTAVVIDAAEGYNPVHDVCHWIGRAAIEGARAGGIRVEAFELDLVAHPGGSGAGVRVELDAAAFARKLHAAARYRPLAAEAAAAYDQHGMDAFRIEFVRHLPPAVVPPATWVPDYEAVGEARVTAGRYAVALRYGQHVRPIVEALATTTARHAAVGPAH
jgi:hypothetical protein